jgi:hypothetical protein
MALCSFTNVLCTALQDGSFKMQQLKYMIGAVQRHYLETLAMYNYLKSWAEGLSIAHTLQHPPSDKQVHRNIMGAFVTDPLIVHAYWMLGIPVWFIRPSLHCDKFITILRVVKAKAFEGETREDTPCSPSLYEAIAGPVTCIAAQDIVPGGIMYGLGIYDNLHTLNRSANNVSRVQELGAPPMFCQCFVSRIQNSN